MDKAGNAANRLKEGLSSMAGKSTIATFIIMALLLIVFVVVYIVYRITRSDLQNVVILKNSTQLYNMKQTYKFDAHQLPPTLNGQEFTYSMWVYLVEYPPMDNHALLMCRGGSGQSVDKSNPIVFLDKNTNRLHISVRTTTPPKEKFEKGTIFDQVLDREKSGFMTASIDYVPLQRWVHVVFVVQDNLMTVYMDGDIYTIANLFDMPKVAEKRPVFAGTSGDVFIGSLPDLPTQPKAFMGKVQFYNFALMQNNVQSLYGEGPLPQTILSRVGLAEYGLRTPIYKVNE